MSTIEADPQQRVRLDLSYDGTAFSGWARQPDRRTVQDVVESALGTVLRLPDVRLRVAGRTDAGVHATGQVAHLDVPPEVWSAQADGVLRRLAGILPPDVRVRSVRAVPAEFDARFAALWRRYEYLITDEPGGANPLRRHAVLAWPRRLDTDAMAQAATHLLGLRDFAAFCRRREGATTIRELQRLDVERLDAERLDAEGMGVEGMGAEIRVTVTADAFCHSMVRSLVGALLAVGEGRREAGWPGSLLVLDRRSDDVPVAPAHGLTLVEVGYPPDAELAARAAATMARRDA